MYKALMTIAEDSVRQLQELQHTQAHLLANLVPRAGGQPAASASLLPLGRMDNLRELVSQTLTRQVQSSQSLWKLALQPRLDASVFAEGLAIQSAVMKRLATQQTQWLQGLQAIANDAASVKKVNTLSTLVNQEGDLYARFNTLLTDQAKATMELLESIQVSLGALAAQKADRAEA